MSIGENIKRIRTEKGLTQKELGKLCGMADSAIRRYENGGANPKIETLQKIAAALHVNTYDLRNDFRSFEANIIEEHPLLAAAKRTGNLNNDLFEDFKERTIIKKLDITKDKQELLFEYNKLNKVGKKEAIKRTQELAEIPKYRKEEDTETDEATEQDPTNRPAQN